MEREQGINIAKIAEIAGVSKATISNYLNNRPGRISERTRERIEQVIRELNYIPHFGARRLMHQRSSKTIGIILADTSLQSVFAVAFYGFVHGGISEVFQKYGYKALLIPSLYERSPKTISYLKELSRGFVDGYLLFDIHKNDPYIEAFVDSHIPFVCFGHVREPQIANYVGTDYLEGIKTAAHYFFDHGILDVAISIGMKNSIVADQMLEGYALAHAERGLRMSEELIISGKHDHSESIFEECLHLCRRNPRPKAFILSEHHYHDLIAAADELNLKLFDDIQVILYNYYTRSKSSGLAYLDAPYFDIGVKAASNLLDMLEGKQTDPVLFPMRLVPAASCGAGV